MNDANDDQLWAADPHPVDLNAGALAPVADEVTLAGAELPVTGRIPADLDGTLIRNGPNPLDGRFRGSGVLDWWPEAAMLHAIDIGDGRARSYRNRWVRTRRWADAGSPGGDGTDHTDGLVDTNPNVNVVAHAGELLALAEGGQPLVIDTGLDTLGPTTVHPALATGATAHPKIDPVTGELISFAPGWTPPYLRYTVSDRSGATTVDQTIDLPRPVMMHDLAITATRSIVLDLNVGLDPAMLDAGFRIPVRWFGDKAARLGVLPRHGGEPTWVEIEPCFVQHVVNAYDDGDTTVVLDAIRYPWYFRLDHLAGGDRLAPDPLGILWRWTIDLETGTATEQALDHRTYLELPRIDESRTGRPYRYLYAVEQPTDTEMRGIRRHDLATGRADRWVPPPGDQNSEPVFVPRPGHIDEGYGWLLACVHRAETDTTDVVVLDATEVAAGPVAAIHLPRRIPAGFHGAWVPSRRGVGEGAGR